VLTVIRLERSTASGEAPKRVVDGGGDLEREGGHGEGESDEIETKTAKWRYLRLQWVAVELLDTSATSICAREEEFTGGSASSSGGRRKGGGRASGSGFYRRAAAAYKEGERGAVIRRFPCGRRWSSIGAAPLTGRERKEGRGEERKGDGGG